MYAGGRQRGQGAYGATARLPRHFVGTGLLNVLTGENPGEAIILR